MHDPSQLDASLDSHSTVPPSFDDDLASLVADGKIGEAGDQESLQEVAEQTAYGEIFLSDLVSRQLTLSVAVAATFLATLFAIPLFNYFLPAVATVHVFGLTVSWLLLGVFIYPLIWGLAYYFVGTSKKYEDDFIHLFK